MADAAAAALATSKRDRQRADMEMQKSWKVPHCTYPLGPPSCDCGANSRGPTCAAGPGKLQVRFGVTGLLRANIRGGLPSRTRSPEAQCTHTPSGGRARRRPHTLLSDGADGGGAINDEAREPVPLPLTLCREFHCTQRSPSPTSRRTDRSFVGTNSTNHNRSGLLKELRALNVTAREVRANQYRTRRASKSSARGRVCTQLSSEGHTLAALKQAGYHMKELVNAGFTTEQLKQEGICRGMRSSGFTIAELRKAGFELKDFKRNGYSAKELRTCAMRRAAPTRADA
jgi:lambda repressor-like predicted transcriptional regulator